MKPGELRPGETAGQPPQHFDAQLAFLGRIRTPWTTREECPRRGSLDGPECRVELDPEWHRAIEGIEREKMLEVLYWMHLARRDLLVQAPGDRPTAGTFALRSPHRPNPVGSSVVALVRVEPGTLVVRGLDCVDGTPLIDVKPAWAPRVTSAEPVRVPYA